MKNLSLIIVFFIVLLLIAGCNEIAPVSSDKSGPDQAASLAKPSGDIGIINPGTYLLYAPAWSDKQSDAVIKAGGKVTFSDPESGFGIAYSDDVNFASKAKKSSAFTGVIADRIISWQKPIETIEFKENAVPNPPNEPFMKFQWNLTALETEAAWAEGYTGLGVRVAVLDGGISANHIDIAPNLDAAASGSFVPGYNFDQDTEEAEEFLHATHVAGIIAAPANSRGTIGVAPEATIIAVKVLDGGSGAFSWVLQGILYASLSRNEGGAGADIINLSMSGIIPKNNRDSAQLLAIFNRVVNTAAQRGVLVISAAGNEGFNFDHSWNYVILPAEAGNGIAVSATGPVGFAFGSTNFRDFASYSNSGNSLVSFAAPGGDDQLYDGPGWYFDMILSPCFVSATSYVYAWSAGTSMSAPAAAGVAALIKQKYPDITVAGLKAKLAQTADDEGKPGHDPYYGHGFVNARRAVTE